MREKKVKVTGTRRPRVDPEWVAKQLGAEKMKDPPGWVKRAASLLHHRKSKD